MPDTSDGSLEHTIQDSRPPSSIIMTRRNIVLFAIVVLLGAIILAYMCFVAFLFASPTLRERVMGVMMLCAV